MLLEEREKVLKTGIKGFRELMVTGENTASALGSGRLCVLATPALAGLVERTCWECGTAARRGRDYCGDSFGNKTSCAYPGGNEGVVRKPAGTVGRKTHGFSGGGF